MKTFSESPNFVDAYTEIPIIYLALLKLTCPIPKSLKQLLEVLAEEARLDQLVSEARRRRQLDHRMLVETLLEERRAMRAAIMKQRQEEDRYARDYEELRFVVCLSTQLHLKCLPAYTSAF